MVYNPAFMKLPVKFIPDPLCGSAPSRFQLITFEGSVSALKFTVNGAHPLITSPVKEPEGSGFTFIVNTAVAPGKVHPSEIFTV
jgi:hypothetical protein